MKNDFRQLRLSQLDRTLEGLRGVPPRPVAGWIASVREALGLTLQQVGKQISASRQSVQQLERAEAQDRITLGALRHTAKALGCDLVYALVPNTGSFSELAECPTRDRATQDAKSVLQTMLLEDQKPENADQLVEGETQRRLNRDKRR
jgi:predicted DNA-binding mobile mystery protein A